MARLPDAPMQAVLRSPDGQFTRSPDAGVPRASVRAHDDPIASGSDSSTIRAIATPRSLDLVHLRTALWFHVERPIDRFVTMDDAQKAASGHDSVAAILPAMTSIADALRDRTREQVLAMPIADRIRLSLTLGDEDADRYARAQGVDRAEAIRRLAVQRQHGRTPSPAAGSGR
jgi:hypothetical protein